MYDYRVDQMFKWDHCDRFVKMLQDSSHDSSGVDYKLLYIYYWMRYIDPNYHLSKKILIKGILTIIKHIDG